MSEEQVVKMGFERAGELEQVKLGELLWDAHAAGMKLLEFTAGRSLEDYRESELLQQIVHTLIGLMADRMAQMQRQFPGEAAKVAGLPQTLETEGLEAGDPRLWQIAAEVVPEAVEQVRGVLELWHEG